MTVVVCLPAGAWSFSVSELAAPGVEVGRLTATDPDLGENAQLEFSILDTDEAEIFNLTQREREAVIVLNKVSDAVCQQTVFKASSRPRMKVRVRALPQTANNGRNKTPNE